MKTDVLVDAVGMIDDEFIRDARAVNKKNAAFSLRRGIALAVAVMLCFTASISALAASDVESAYRLLYSISPLAAQTLKPVKESCVNNGIRMEVVSAEIEGNAARIYVAMRDLEGDRIDDTVDLFDSYLIRDTYGCSSGCYLAGYDGETDTALFAIHIRQAEERNFQKDKITFSVSRFLSHKKEFAGIVSEGFLADVSLSPATGETVRIRGWSGDEGILPDDMAFLEAQTPPLFAPVDGVTVTAMGYIDGRLHIQAHYEDILRTDNHGWVFLRDAMGEEIQPGMSVSFWDEAGTGSYEEYVFDISHEELNRYALYGNFTTCDQLVEGNWQLTFQIDVEQ